MRSEVLDDTPFKDRKATNEMLKYVVWKETGRFGGHISISKGHPLKVCCRKV